MTAFLLALASLFPIMNPFAALPVFGELTADMERGARNRTALTAALAVLAILVVSTLGGRFLLQGLGVSLPALQIAGGIVVGLTAIGMVTGRAAQLHPEEKQDSATRSSVGVVPMAMPLIAGPGAISVVIAAAGKAAGDWIAIGAICLAALVMSALVYLVLRFGEVLLARLGATGLGVLTRIFGLVILAIAVELVTDGLGTLFPVLDRSTGS
ncbi:MAG: NAAT family transporter [Actinomycetales bacterium]|nr:NAAT family transporter [Actinomycetales bacterium]